MKSTRLVALLIVLSTATASAQVDPVAIRVPDPQAWTGQRVVFFVELRTRGAFAGSAGFSLPKIPRTVIIKIGNPVVSSQQFDGESWFVQTHEFALFSQRSGSWEIPSFEVRFGSRDGFTGPVIEQQVKTPAATVDIRRPPGSESFGFLITTDSIEITETWDPQPGSARRGAVFTRTISQRAEQMTGMALAAPPTAVPEGVRVYFGTPEVSDEAERGALAGKRRDTITYVLQEPGTVTLPAVTYVWWNPQSKQLGMRTLPAVTFEVAAATEVAATRTHVTTRWTWLWWTAAGLLILAVCVWQRRRIVASLNRWGRRLNPPDRIAARKLLRACRRHDVMAASRAWARWLSLQPVDFEPIPQLRSAVLKMQRHLFSRASADSWNGRELKLVFRAQRKQLRSVFTRNTIPALPRLNSNGCSFSQG